MNEKHHFPGGLLPLPIHMPLSMYPPHILQIFVRNKAREGLTRVEIAALLRKRLRWSTLDPGKMNDLGKERYYQVDEFIKQLEAQNDNDPP